MKRAVCLAALVLVLTGCEEDVEPYDLNFDIPRSEAFEPSLSAYGLYEEPLASLQPADRVLPYALSSELFTDYASKQRLIRVPEGSAITQVDTTLEYPEGTILVKTFYYPNDMRHPSGSKRVIETRLLIKTEGQWNVATYLWNAEQTDATLLLEGTTIAMAWLDEAGQSVTTDYVVPHEGECVTCHQLNGESAFIGPTLHNLNRTVVRDSVEVNQLAYLHTEGVLDEGDWASAPTLPDYRDLSVPLENRARAYLEINCAHCHNPGGWDEVPERNFDFRYTTPLNQTGLQDEARALTRQLENGTMPYLGTTLLHDEGISLVLEYVNSL